jgi:hypothetical protein
MSLSRPQAVFVAAARVGGVLAAQTRPRVPDDEGASFSPHALRKALDARSTGRINVSSDPVENGTGTRSGMAPTPWASRVAKQSVRERPIWPD